MTPGPAFAGPAHEAPGLGLWRRFLAWVMHRRVRITAIFFVLLIAEDVWNKTDPHNLTNLTDYKVLLGLGLVFSGLILRSWAAGTLHKGTEITTSGPYGLVRHPLYIGSFMMMIGFCQLIDDRENIWFVMGPMLALYIYRALTEEKALAAAFPDQWDEFAKKVPRLIPRRLPKQLFSTWDAGQWMRNREYNAVIAVFLGLVALQIWQYVE